jgi:hypothetical protein
MAAKTIQEAIRNALTFQQTAAQRAAFIEKATKEQRDFWAHEVSRYELLVIRSSDLTPEQKDLMVQGAHELFQRVFKDISAQPDQSKSMVDAHTTLMDELTPKFKCSIPDCDCVAMRGLAFCSLHYVDSQEFRK